MSLFASKRTALLPHPLAEKTLLLSDLDGIVYRGQLAIPGAVQCIRDIAQTIRVGYLTNNASRTDEVIAQQLRTFGLVVDATDIVTSSQAATQLLARTVEPGSTVLVVGGDGLIDELTKAGFRVTRTVDDSPAAVVQGFSPEVGWEQLAQASFALAEQDNGDVIPWIATNNDWTFPLERGIAPGNGTLVSAVHIAVQRLPEFAGKPQKAIFETAFSRFGTRNALMIGDRLDTDIQGANESGISSAFVLTGVDRPKQLLAAAPNMRPNYIIADLAGLNEPYPSTQFDSKGAAHVGSAKVKMNGPIVEVVHRGDDALNLLRAACAAIWSSGLAIYGLRVPEELYQDHWR